MRGIHTEGLFIDDFVFSLIVGGSLVQNCKATFALAEFPWLSSIQRNRLEGETELHLDHIIVIGLSELSISSI
jgi:hypothetical protein